MPRAGFEPSEPGGRAMPQVRGCEGLDAPSRIRTCGLLLRRESLCPAELSGPARNAAGLVAARIDSRRVPELSQKTIDGIAYREALPLDLPSEGHRSGTTALAVHGYPTSSYLWRNVAAEAAATGTRFLAPDLPGFGDSPADLPGTWERQVENLE